MKTCNRTLFKLLPMSTDLQPNIDQTIAVESECAMRRGYRRPPFLTIGAWCSWLHSVNCKSSMKDLVSAFFVCVWILHVSADICMFLMFAANSLRVGRRWESANIIAKNASEMHQQLGTYLSKSIPNPSKVDQNGAQERSKSDIGSKSAKQRVHN